MFIKASLRYNRNKTNVTQLWYLLNKIKLLLPQQIKVEIICNSYERESQIISYNLSVINLNLEIALELIFKSCLMKAANWCQLTEHKIM